MATLTRNRALWLAAETTFGTDPSADGSGYTFVPCTSVGELPTGKEPIPTQVLAGDNLPTKPVAGVDGGEFEIAGDLFGFGAAVGDGSSPAADDFFDLLLTHLFGLSSKTEIAGEGFNTGSAAGTAVLDTSVANLGTGLLIPAWETGVPAALARTQWGLVTGGTPPSYNVTPNWAGTPTTAAVAHGTKQWRYQLANGPSLAFAYKDDDVTYTLGGCSLRSFSIVDEVGDDGQPPNPTRWSATVRFDRASTGGKGSLPTPAAPSYPPIVGVGSPLAFNGAFYGHRRVEFSLGYNAQDTVDRGSENGRAGYARLALEPRITFEPLRTDDIRNLQRNLTEGPLIAQFGRGNLASSRVNTMAVALGLATCTVQSVDQSGRARQTVVATASRPASGSFITVARA